MPNFKEFIKGFEEKPEAEQPKTPEVKVEQPNPQTDYSKPYKTFGGKEHFIEPYTDFAGNKRFDIKTRKEGGEFDLGSRAGYDFKDEGEARKKIDEWEQYHKPQPKQGSFEQVFGGTSEVEDEKEAQPDGYYKDDNGEIYMMKGGKDYYPVGEEERTDFFRAFNNQNKEKAKEMANDPETARSFERIYADLDKGFEETYKRKPTQEEKDAIRDIARLQTALVVMARKK